MLCSALLCINSINSIIYINHQEVSGIIICWMLLLLLPPQVQTTITVTVTKNTYIHTFLHQVKLSSRSVAKSADSADAAAAADAADDDDDKCGRDGNCGDGTERDGTERLQLQLQKHIHFCINLI
jgi:hypothetical protein